MSPVADMTACAGGSSEIFLPPVRDIVSVGKLKAVTESSIAKGLIRIAYDEQGRRRYMITELGKRF